MAGTGETPANRPGDGDTGLGADVLSPLLYAELKLLAARAMRGERKGHTLQTTALVHEAWLRVAGQRNLDPANRDQILAISARMMRRVLVDHARRRQADKRKGIENALIVSSRRTSRRILATRALKLKSGSSPEM